MRKASESKAHFVDTYMLYFGIFFKSQLSNVSVFETLILEIFSRLIAWTNDLQFVLTTLIIFSTNMYGCGVTIRGREQLFGGGPVAYTYTL